MGTFDSNFLWLRDPHGGVENLSDMKAAGFEGVFCNTRDFPASEWEKVIRPRAQSLGMFCGPWARTTDSHDAWSSDVLYALTDLARRWGSPLIVNSEKELHGTGGDATQEIAYECQGLDAAVAVEPWPFTDVDWNPLRDIPILAQISPDYSSAAADPEGCKWQWQNVVGVKCVYYVFGTFGGQTPDDYNLQAPYSLYTADDCGADYMRWKPTSTGYVGCMDAPAPPNPSNGGDVTKIGKQDGITAAVNRFRDLDPQGTKLQKAGGSWPDISTLTIPVSDYKAWDKLQRTLQILKDDHDAAVG